MSKDFDTSHLSGTSKKLADLVTKFITERSGAAPSGGGCRAFYSPKEWKERGEDYGLTSELILVHDGGDLAPYCNLDYEEYKMHDALYEFLKSKGYYLESCTCWYSAVYKV